MYTLSTFNLNFNVPVTSPTGAPRPPVEPSATYNHRTTETQRNKDGCPTKNGAQNLNKTAQGMQPNEIRNNHGA